MNFQKITKSIPRSNVVNRFEFVFILIYCYLHIFGYKLHATTANAISTEFEFSIIIYLIKGLKYFTNIYLNAIIKTQVSGSSVN